MPTVISHISQLTRSVCLCVGQAVDAASALLLWTKAMGVVAVSASGNPDNIKRLATTFSALPDLTSEEVDEISAAGRAVHFRGYVSVTFS
jgi:diketogulonate reductase-like aldo/keto reductase